MVIETLKMPTVAEVDALGDEILRIPASYEEYLEWEENCAFNISYFNNEITIMGNASYYHEKLVGLIIVALNKIVPKTYSILGSNLKIHVPDPLSPDDFNADVSVIEGEPEFITLPSGKKSIGTILNPILVVEVLSKSTMSVDLGDKLLAYKKIPTLQYALFINQYESFITVYERKGPHHWELHDYIQPEESFSIFGQSITVGEIYSK